MKKKLVLIFLFFCYLEANSQNYNCLKLLLKVDTTTISRYGDLKAKFTFENKGQVPLLVEKHFTSDFVESRTTSEAYFGNLVWEVERIKKGKYFLEPIIVHYMPIPLIGLDSTELYHTIIPGNFIEHDFGAYVYYPALKVGEYRIRVRYIPQNRVKCIRKHTYSNWANFKVVKDTDPFSLE